MHSFKNCLLFISLCILFPTYAQASISVSTAYWRQLPTYLPVLSFKASNSVERKSHLLLFGLVWHPYFLLCILALLTLRDSAIQ